MPSGHFQQIFYSLIFILFVCKKKKYSFNILYIYFIVIISCLHNCLYYKYHTLFQIFIGSIIGSLLGYFFYNLAMSPIFQNIY